MDRRSSYEFKDVKRMRRDTSATYAITKQQQQPNRQPLAVFKSNHDEELNNQVYSIQYDKILLRLCNRLNKI